MAALEAAMEQDLRTLPWMTDATRAQAIAKLHAITNNVGVTVARDDYFGDWMRTAEAAHERRREKIGQLMVSANACRVW